MLFIILFLHQTTTIVSFLLSFPSCLSSCSYIKPQLAEPSHGIGVVVYHLVPTSNHNTELDSALKDRLFIILFLHQTTTSDVNPFQQGKLFIILFLHQTTTFSKCNMDEWCCLSSCSYIKPQLRWFCPFPRWVVYHLVPTSNHNLQFFRGVRFQLFIILFLHQTTTGLLLCISLVLLFIILFLHQTTTHLGYEPFGDSLFIILFLHQTTTYSCKSTGNQ